MYEYNSIIDTSSICGKKCLKMFKNSYEGLKRFDLKKNLNKYYELIGKEI